MEDQENTICAKPVDGGGGAALPPPTPLQIAQSEAQKIVDAPSAPIEANQATLQVITYGVNNGFPTTWNNSLGSNGQFWDKYGKSIPIDAGAIAAWDAYKIWLQDQIDNNPYVFESPYHDIGYAWWWLSVGSSNGYNSYKWN